MVQILIQYRKCILNKGISEIKAMLLIDITIKQYFENVKIC